MEGKEPESMISRCGYEKVAEKVVESVGHLSDMEEVRRNLNMLLKGIV